jgi:hypothetical protein
MASVLIQIYIILGLATTGITVIITTEGGKKPTQYKPLTYAIATIIWPVFSTIIVKNYIKEKQKRKDKSQFSKDYFNF